MKKDNSIYLKDIQSAISKVEEYTKNISLENLQNDNMRQDAIIRQFEIIGEAASRITDEFKVQNPGFPIKEAVGMRNFLIHGYDEVDIEVVWKTINEDIPLLKSKLLSLK